MNKDKGLKRSLFVLFLVVATELIGFGLIIPVLPVLAAQFDINYFLLGILMASFSFAQFIAAPFLGSLSDRYGRKPILILSKCGTIFSYIILAYSQSFSMFLFARLLDGFTGGNIAVARAYIVDITNHQSRPKGMAIIGISFGIGFVLGPILGSILFQFSNGLFVASLVAGGFSFCALLFTIFLLDEPKTHSTTFSVVQQFSLSISQLKQAPVIIVCITYLMYMILFSGLETTLSMFLSYIFLLDPNQISLVFVFSGIVGFVCQGMLSRYASTKYVPFVSCGLACLSLCFVGLALSKTMIFVLFFLAILTVSICFVTVYLPSLLSTFVESDKIGAVMGVYEGIGSLGRVLGPLIAYSVPLLWIEISTLFMVVLFYY